MTAAAGDLDPTLVETLTRTARWKVTGGGATGSTNNDAKALARAGHSGGVVVLASSQSAGRGRFDRAWESPPGGLYVSVLLRPSLAAGQVGAVPLAAGVAVANALSWLDGSLRDVLALKWPNDVLAGGRKLAGILVESAVSGDRVEWVVVGIGVNMAPFESSATAGVQRAASLSECVGAGSPVLQPERLAAAILDALAEIVDLLEAPGEGPEALIPDYAGWSGDLGREVIVRDRSGATVAEGAAAGFDAQGRLLVQTVSGRHAVAAGEVTLRG